MAVRYPLIIDATDNNKIKEIPLNDSLNLSTNSIVNAVNITASGTLTVANLVVDSNSVSINGNSIATVALTNSYTDLSNRPSLFDGQYSSLTGRPTIPTTIETLANVGSTSPADGQALIYNATLGRYEPSDVADVSIDISSQSISELSDVVTTSTALNQVLKWNGAAFVNGNVDFTELSGAENVVEQGDTFTGPTIGFHTGDVKGSVFADDSTLLVDGVNGTIPYGVIDGRPTVVTDLTNDAGYVTNAQLVSGSLTINVTNQGIHTGTVDGDVNGSVFADDSTILVDAVNGEIPGYVKITDLKTALQDGAGDYAAFKAWVLANL